MERGSSCATFPSSPPYQHEQIGKSQVGKVWLWVTVSPSSCRYHLEPMAEQPVPSSSYEGKREAGYI